MTEAEWLDCTDPVAIWAPFQGTASDRKWRLFLCACCRLWHCVSSVLYEKALETAERAADDLLDWEAVAAAEDEILHRMLDGASDRAHQFAFWALHPHPGKGVGAMSGTARGSERQRQIKVVRELFGNPFHPVNVQACWLAWNDHTVPKIAQAIYDERAFERLPILADALEDAGCDNTDILNHCCVPGPHVRGCWVVDLLLGKN